jgi:hypothetical protein
MEKIINHLLEQFKQKNKQFNNQNNNKLQLRRLVALDNLQNSKILLAHLQVLEKQINKFKNNQTMLLQIKKKSNKMLCLVLGKEKLYLKLSKLKVQNLELLKIKLI